MAAFLLPGGIELWIILAVVLVIFGPTQVPKLAKMFGKSAKALKDGIDGKLAEAEEEKTEEKAAEKPADKPVEQAKTDEGSDIPKPL
jgi:sec-independent protein translocase protein TatA